MTRSQKLVFITSLERSGSTLLDLTIGLHPKLISFGEVARVLLPHSGEGIKSVSNRACSCGATVADCEFWGPLTESISQNEHISLSARYDLFLSHFAKVFGADYTPVDSSKFIQAMEALLIQKQRGVDIRLLFTIRDVRGWLSSSRRAERRKRELPYKMLFSRDIFRWWKPYLRHNILRKIPFWLPLEWYVRNKRIENFIQVNKFSTVQLSYEKLSLKTDKTLGTLYDFIGVEKLSLPPQNKSHIVRGNRMAFDKEQTLVINYDDQWKSETWTKREAKFWPFVMKKNTEWVYTSSHEK